MRILARPDTACAWRSDQLVVEKVGSYEIDHRPRLSAAERPTPQVVSRFDGLNASLDQINFATKKFFLASIVGPEPAKEQALRAVRETVEVSKGQVRLLEGELRKLALLALPVISKAQLSEEGALKASGDLLHAPEAIRNALSPFSGSSDFFEQLLAMIGFIKGEYLEIYEALLTKYSDFYKEFNETIMAKMGDWITGKSDGKEVEISGELRAALEALRNKYQQAPDGVLYPVSGSATQEEAQKWAKALGLPDSCVQPDGNGGYRVMMDLSPLDAMIAAAPNGTVTWDTAKFQAWQTGFNSQEGDLKNQLQLFTTKYGNANSYHENFNKILSSQLSQYAEMLKALASGIG